MHSVAATFLNPHPCAMLVTSLFVHCFTSDALMACEHGLAGVGCLGCAVRCTHTVSDVCLFTFGLFEIVKLVQHAIVNLLSCISCCGCC